jgi:hypothetical protein
MFRVLILMLINFSALAAPTEVISCDSDMTGVAAADVNILPNFCELLMGQVGT